MRSDTDTHKGHDMNIYHIILGDMLLGESIKYTDRMEC